MVTEGAYCPMGRWLGWRARGRACEERGSGDGAGRLWKAADELRANSTLAPSEARGPILGLIFLAYAEHRFESVRPRSGAVDCGFPSGDDRSGGALGHRAGRPRRPPGDRLGPRTRLRLAHHQRHRHRLRHPPRRGPDRIGEVDALGLDETLFCRVGPWRTQGWSTSIVDVRAGQLLDVVEGRSAAAPCAWLAARDEAWRDRIAWATLDLSGPYRKVFDTMLPDATQVADRSTW